MHGPIWPNHEGYQQALQEAKQMYDEWEQRAVRRQGISVFTRKPLTENVDDDYLHSVGLED